MMLEVHSGERWCPAACMSADDDLQTRTAHIVDIVQFRLHAGSEV